MKKIAKKLIGKKNGKCLHFMLGLKITNVTAIKLFVTKIKIKQSFFVCFKA